MNVLLSLQDADLTKLQTFQKTEVAVTANLIQSFSTGRKPQPGETIVYAPGNYDLLRILNTYLLNNAI
jgi:hypothetical protein